MALRFAATRLLPSLLLFLVLLAVAVLADALLHRSGLAWVGRYGGIVGTALILLSFLYSLRKRNHLRAGSVKAHLRSHEALGWIGALAILVHGGIHFQAILPWLALAAMLIVVASGLTGRFLLEEARASLRDREQALRHEGRPPADIERELLGHALLVGTMAQWRKVHMPLTMIFAALSLLHITATCFFWGW